MGWSMTQVSGLAQGIFKARVKWIDGIHSARRAMEQAVYQIRERARACSRLDASAEAKLRAPIYAHCLGYEVPRTRCADAASTAGWSAAGWVGAAQVGPFAPTEAGDSSDEDCRKGQDGPRLKRRTVRDPAFVELLGAAERMEQCIRCGVSPCWSDQGETKVPGGLCRQCVMGPGSSASAAHCSNCGVAQAPHQWVMVAVHNWGCQQCAKWYTD